MELTLKDGERVTINFDNAEEVFVIKCEKRTRSGQDQSGKVSIKQTAGWELGPDDDLVVFKSLYVSP